MKYDRIRYRDAIPKMPASFCQRIQTTIEGMEETMKRSHRRTIMLVAALMTIALLAGAGFAAVQSDLLERLFPEGAPPEAERILVSDALTDEHEGLRLTVREHLYDGRNLHLNWTVESERDDAVFYLTEYQLRNADAAPMEISRWSGRNSSWDTIPGCLTALNVPVGSEPGSKTCLGEMSSGFLPEEVPSEPWTYTLHVYAYTTDLTPVALDEDEDLNNMPDERIQELADRHQIGIEYGRFSRIDRYPKYLVASAEYEKLNDWSRQGMRAARVSAHDTCGLLEPLAHLSVTISLDPNDVANVQATRLAEPQALVFKDMTVWMDELEFDLAGIHMSYRVPMDAMQGDHDFTLDQHMIILDQDQNILNPAFVGTSTSWTPDDDQGIASYAIIQGGGAVTKPPTELTFIRAEGEMRDLIWEESSEPVFEYLKLHPELRDEAKLTLE